MPAILTKKVCIVEAKRFMVDCLKRVGVNENTAEDHTNLLLTADIINVYTHGLNKLESYINDIQSRVCMPNNSPEIVKETLSTAVVNANNCLGSTSSAYAMDVAITKAKQTGAGWVVVRAANHFGIAGYWAMRAAKQNLIGIALTNSSPAVVPTRSKKAALGTNAVSVVAPGLDNEMYYIDMTTAATSLESINWHRINKIPLKIDLALDSDGNVTTDPEVAYKAKLLMPLGGGEKNSGYKGYGLSAAVEILCGISAGAHYSYKIRQWRDHNTVPANLGQTFAALDYTTFAPGFQDRLTECLRYWRNLEPTDPKKPVLSPGDKEWEYAAKSEACQCINYSANLLKSCNELAKLMNVPPIVLAE